MLDTGDGDALASWRTPTEAKRSFYVRCGSPLFFRAPRWDGEVHVAVAALDDDPGKLPGARVYADRPPAWLPVPEDGLPRQTRLEGVAEGHEFVDLRDDPVLLGEGETGITLDAICFPDR